HTSWDGAATSASARLRESSRTSKRGSVEDCVCIFGGSGEPGKTASKNCAIVAYRSSMQRWRQARPRASGECQDTRRSNRRCATAISTRSVSPESTRPPKLNSIEPPRYGSVCQVVWEGRCREASPYPDLGRTTGFRRREGTPRLRPKQALIEAPAKRREGWTPGLQASPGEQRESTRSGPSLIGSPRNSNCEKFTNASERGSQFPFASTRKSARAGAVSLARRRTFSVPARALERLDDDHPAAATRASARRQRCFGLAVGLGALALRRRRGGGERLADAFDVAGSNRAAVMADAVEAAGQHVQEKAADELGGVEGHSPDPVAAFDPVVLPF